MMGITLGRSKGTGRFGNIRIPSFVIWYKSKFLSQRLLSFLDCIILIVSFVTDTNHLTESRTLGTAASRLAEFVNGTDVS